MDVKKLHDQSCVCMETMNSYLTEDITQYPELQFLSLHLLTNTVSGNIKIIWFSYGILREFHIFTVPSNRGPGNLIQSQAKLYTLRMFTQIFYFQAVIHNLTQNNVCEIAECFGFEKHPSNKSNSIIQINGICFFFSRSSKIINYGILRY